MKLISASLCLTIILIAQHVQAQDQSFFDRLHGTVIDHRIFFQYDSAGNDGKGSLNCRVDDEKEWYPARSNLIFNVHNEHDNYFRVMFEFYNPLRYTIKVTQKEIDDPVFKSIQEFTSHLPNVVPTTIGALDLAAKSVHPAVMALDGGNQTVSLKGSILLAEWIYEFSNALDPTKSAGASSDDEKNRYANLLETINRIGSVDTYLFGDIVVSVDNKGEGYDVPNTERETVSGWIKRCQSRLYAVGNCYATFRTALGESKTVRDELVRVKEQARKDLEFVKNLLTEDFDAKMAPFIRKEKLDQFRKYSVATGSLLSANASGKMETNDVAVEKYDEFINKADNFFGTFSKANELDPNSECSPHFKEYSSGNLGYDAKSMISLDYSIVKLKADGSEDASGKLDESFTVGEKKTFYVFAGTGVLLSNFRYPVYAVATDNGVSRVKKVDEEKFYSRPAVYLNFIDPYIASGGLYPYLQFGVSTGINHVILPIGVGLLIKDAYSISFGALLGWRKVLDDSLNEGDVVKDDAELKSHLTDRPFTDWYFSVNYNFGK